MVTLLRSPLRHIFTRQCIDLRSIVFIIMLYSLCWASLANGAVYSDFGPETFVRSNGSPVEESRNFPQLRQDGTYTLQVLNGGPENGQYEPVSSAIITLNGKQIFGPNAFRQRIQILEKAVTLQPNNTLTVELRGKPNGALRINIVGDYPNLPPSLISKPPRRVLEDNQYRYQVQATDPDEVLGDTLSYQLLQSPESMTINPDSGLITWLPENAHVGSHTIEIQVKDGEGLTDSDTYTLEVINTNDAPTLEAIPSSNVDEDTLYQYTVSANDVDQGDILSYQLIQAPDGMTINPLGEISWLPENKDVDTHTITVQVSDLSEATAKESYQLTVINVNDAPVAEAQQLNGLEDNSVDILLTASDIDSEQLSYHIQSQPQHGVLQGSGNRWQYTPDTDYYGDDSFTFVANDGELDSSPATIQIHLAPVNDKPVATPQTMSVNEDSTAQIMLSGVDVDTTMLNYEITLAPAFGQLSGTPPQLSYQPNLNYNGPDAFEFTVNDGELTSDAATVAIEVIAVNDPPIAYDLSVETEQGNSVDIILDGRDVESINLTYQIVNPPQQGQLTGNSSSYTYQPNANFYGEESFTYRVNDGDQDSNQATVTIKVNQGQNSEACGGVPCPPDPSTIATEISQNQITSFTDNIAFLYESATPVQTDVQTDAIKAQRATVLRGNVRQRDNQPLGGVKVTILNHPALGQTYTREDGNLDMVVNGGGHVTVEFKKEGYLPVQRTVKTPWNDYVILPDVVMTPLDNQVTTIDLNNTSGPQLAEGSVVVDQDGERQARILFPQGVAAEMVMPDGSTQPLTTLNVRATEYTVGENGPEAMPGALPPTSAYTYAVELSVDEAIAAGAKGVNFSQPVYLYVDNFLNFPAGEIVPLGYYDLERVSWISSRNSGRVIEILGVDGNGSALLDIDGSGQAADAAALSALGIEQGELLQLAGKYSVGESLWRSRIDHFTAWDCNWPIFPPSDAQAPTLGMAIPTDDNVDTPSLECGSIIECEHQVLGERVDITGTPFSLNYRNNRTQGWIKGYTVGIPLTGDTYPVSLKQIVVKISASGVIHEQQFSPAPNLEMTYTWDGLDSYGRKIQGKYPVTVEIGYVYDGVYTKTTRFGYIGNGIPITGDRSREELTLWKKSKADLGIFDARQAIAGWTLNVQHYYDPRTGELIFGDGRANQQRAENAIERVGGTLDINIWDYVGDGGLATESALRVHEMKIADNGDIYIIEVGFGHYIRKIDGETGIITTVAGDGNWCYRRISTCGDGQDALSAQINASSLSLDGNGGIYLAEREGRIRYIDKNNIITTIAGNGMSCSSVSCDNGDGGLAINATLTSPTEVTAGLAGCDYYFIESKWGTFNRIRYVDCDGVISTVAGVGEVGYTGDGGPATQAQIYADWGMAMGADGSLYFIAHNHGNIIRKIDPNGIISTVAGNLLLVDQYTGDGGPATEAGLDFIYDIAVDDLGNLYMLEYDYGVIRMVDSEGMINTIVGDKEGLDWNEYPFSEEYLGINGFALDLKLAWPQSLDIGQDGSLYVDSYIDETTLYRIKRNNNIPHLTAHDFFIKDKEKALLYVFDQKNRHVETINTLTGSTLYSFGYVNDFLTTVEDSYGNTTTISRYFDGKPYAITSPDGLMTNLSLNPNDYLKTISNPQGEVVSFTYDDNGLLRTMSDAKNHASYLYYNGLGQLIRDENPAGGFWEINRTKLDNGYQVAMTSAEERTKKYTVEDASDGTQIRTELSANGSYTQEITFANGDRKKTLSDGVIITTQESPDPRFGRESPIASNTVVLMPSGLSSVAEQSQDIVLADTTSPLSLVSKIDTTTYNGRITTTEYSAQAQQYTTTTPEGRIATSQVDQYGKLTRMEVPNIAVTRMNYDLRGRLEAITQGSGIDARGTTFAYGSDGFVDAITDALQRTTYFEHDLIGRVTQITGPDSSVTGFTYDANGNITTITPPGREAHIFHYTPVNQEEKYEAPQVAVNPTTTQYFYNLDKQLTKVLRPDWQEINYGYGDTTGQLLTMSQSRGTTQYGYDETTGQLNQIITPELNQLDFTYDGFLPTGEIWSGEINGQVNRGYDNNFWLRTLTTNGSAISYDYDNDGLLIQAGEMTVGRDLLNGLQTGTQLGNMSTAQSYNNFAELDIYQAKHGSNTFYSVDYERDRAGRITRKTETINGNSGITDYIYDTTGRLDQVIEDGTTIADYEYDANGNRNGGYNRFGNITTQIDGQDRLLNYNGVSYTYTANGELYAKEQNGAMTTYQYDLLGNLIQVTLPGDITIDYIIDGQNRRIGKKVNGTLIQGFLYQDQLNPIAELDGNGQVISQFIYGTKANVPDYMIKDNTVYRIISDYLGSPRLVVNIADGSIIQQIDYDEFGNIISDTNPGFQPFGFAGGIYDQHTQLTRFGARDYDAEIGRWTAKDPILFAAGQSNLYAYVHNDPVNLIDPTGLEECTCSSAPPRLPFGESVDKNIDRAKRAQNPFWWKTQVQNGGDWDYKQTYRFFENAGNFNYGATGRSMGMPRQVLERGAGWAQSRAGTSNPDWGKWWGDAPYGDDPNDQKWIQKGMDYFDNGWYESCN